VVKKGKVTDEVVRLRADEEFGHILAPADTPIGDGRQARPRRARQDHRAREGRPSMLVDIEEVHYMDVSARSRSSACRPR
jgi:DNA-directed RNA polymerase beta subunit